MRSSNNMQFIKKNIRFNDNQKMIFQLQRVTNSLQLVFVFLFLYLYLFKRSIKNGLERIEIRTGFYLV